MDEFHLRPDPANPRLTERVSGVDHEGNPVETAVVVERPLTLFLNGQEIVTVMTISDYPDYLAVGYLLNQNMLRADDTITGIDYDDDLDVVHAVEETRQLAGLLERVLLDTGRVVVVTVGVVDAQAHAFRDRVRWEVDGARRGDPRRGHVPSA